MGKKLYVGNLPYNVSSSDLEQLFSQHGTVESAEVISDRMTGRSKGFGFVEMGSDQEAQAAIAALNGQDHAGRPLTVNEAKPRESRGGGGGGGGGGRGGYGGGRGGGGGGRRDRY
jgi:RNA recognition motif-containing protein